MKLSGLAGCEWPPSWDSGALRVRGPFSVRFDAACESAAQSQRKAHRGNWKAITLNVEAGTGIDLLTQLAPSGAEDFITKVFCWLLKNTSFGSEFLARLIEIGDAALPVVGSDCCWTTQKSYEIGGSAKRPDMVCESKETNTALIFEHKVRADLHDGQIEDYRRIGNKWFENSGVILITARKGQGGQDPDCHLLWRQVHRWLIEWMGEGDDDAGAFVARCFLALLEERGLGPMKEITVEQLRAIPSALEGERRLKLLMNAVAGNPIWGDLVADIGDETVKDDRKRSVGFSYGRCGLYVLDAANWSPGVFVGVLKDSSDHGPKSVNNQQGSGPAACVIVSVDKKWHGQYETSEAYLKLAGAFRRNWPGTAADDWRIHEYERNRWHPLAVYKPLKAVFRTARTGDGQVDAFVEEVGAVAKTVLDLDEFSHFRRSLV